MAMASPKLHLSPPTPSYSTPLVPTSGSVATIPLSRCVKLGWPFCPFSFCTSTCSWSSWYTRSMEPSPVAWNFGLCQCIYLSVLVCSRPRTNSSLSSAVNRINFSETNTFISHCTLGQDSNYAVPNIGFGDSSYGGKVLLHRASTRGLWSSG